MYRTVVHSNKQALDTVSGLYLQRDLHLDACFKTGSFYKGSALWPEIKQDIKPCSPDVLKIDVTKMPHPRCCVRSIMFDPPWLILGSRETARNKMQLAFGSFKSPEIMYKFQADALQEISRVLIPGGWLITKVQDCSYGRQKYFLSIYQVIKAREMGLDLIDSLILISASNYRAANAGRLSAVSSHCFFHVFRKAMRAKRITRY